MHKQETLVTAAQIHVQTKKQIIYYTFEKGE